MFTGDQWIAISHGASGLPLVLHGKYLDLPLCQTMFPNDLLVRAQVRLAHFPAGSLVDTQARFVALSLTSASLVLMAGIAALVSAVAIALVRSYLTSHLISFHLLLSVLNQPTYGSL